MKESWNEAHNQLMISMQKEIHILREILANMHREELSLMLHDKKSWNEVMEERAQMIQRLSCLRSDRMQATTTLQSLVSKKEKREPSFEQLFPVEDGQSLEILYLRDQLMALTERMNKQNLRNINLFQEVQHRLEQPPSAISRPLPQKSKRAKISITTIKPTQ